MKKYLHLTVLSYIVIFSFSAGAQSLKFGHINLQALIEMLPDLKATEAQFDNFQKELEDVLADMQKNYQARLLELEQLEDDASEIKRNARIAELQNIQQRIQAYQQNARQQVQQKYQELLDPLYAKAITAVEEVAKEHELMYVFDTGSNVILYKSNQSVDLLPLVKKKLGIGQ